MKQSRDIKNRVYSLAVVLHVLAQRERLIIQTMFLLFKGLFTWREENPSTRKILEGGISLRWVYMQKFRPVSCPSREG